MPNHEQFRDSQLKEDEFFSSLDRELLRKWRRHLEAEKALNELSASTGIADREILLELQSLDYDPATAALLRIVPLVQVAWSDGAVNPHERQRISQIAGMRGLDQEDPGWPKLTRYLEDRPSDRFFRMTLRALRASLETATMEQQKRSRRELLADCTAVAMVSRGFIGYGTMSEAERLAIDEIAAAVEIG
jgi:tellurite resistance protein